MILELPMMHGEEWAVVNFDNVLYARRRPYTVGTRLYFADGQTLDVDMQLEELYMEIEEAENE